MYNLPILAKSLQLHNLQVNCARELFKLLKDSANLLVCNKQNFLVLGFRFFVGDVISGIGFCSAYLALG